MNPITKLVAIYCRVSTARQEEEGTIENQVSILEELAQEKGYKIVDRFLDDGWSGDTLIRPALDNLRQSVKDKRWEAVLVYDPDRIARRYSYQELVMDELKETGIEVIFKTVSSPKNPEDKIIYGVRGIFAEYERMKIAERFRLGKLRKVKSGNLLVSEALYGYFYVKKNEKEHGYYEINENEARVVKMIFDWVGNDGVTLRGVVKKLQELNIKPRKSKRGVWNTSTLTTMLRNEAYIGNAHWGSSYAVVPENPTKNDKYKKVKKSSRRIKPREEWITNSIPVPVIIDKNLFEKTREQLKSNYDLSKRNTKNQYLLSKRIWCECGRRRVGEGPQRGKHLYYRCTDRVYSFPLKSTCESRGINARISDRLVWEKLAELMSSKKLMTDQIERWNKNNKTKTGYSDVDVEILEKEILKLKSQEERYNKAYGLGVYNMEELIKYNNPIKENIKSLEKQIAEINYKKSQINATMMPNQEAIESFAREVVIKFKDLSFETRKAILINVVDRIIASPEKLQVYGHIPITIENYVAFFSSHRNRRSPKCW
jgi:site-specific DNA recombinase